MKILILDNYDSFTYNLYQSVGELLGEGAGQGSVEVVHNNEITTSEITRRGYDKIIISPGPGRADDPEFFGVCAEVITTLGPTIPILGVCLGMQGIADCFGGSVVQAAKPMHGKTSIITHDGKGVFRELPQNLEVMRYHSLVVDPGSVPAELTVTATTRTNEIMGLRHTSYPLEGIQFHPESFATKHGQQIIKNFLMNVS
jgi:anthranilate synthase component II